jgi:hypothetical protein
MKITKIELPQQTGCQHINVFLDNGEIRSYHITNFEAKENTQFGDDVFLQLKTLYKSEGMKSRDDIKQSFTNLTLQ